MKENERNQADKVDVLVHKHVNINKKSDLTFQYSIFKFHRHVIFNNIISCD